MKYITFWMKKNNRGGVGYTEEPALVVERVNAVSLRLLFPDGTIKRDLMEYYEVICE